MVEVLLTILGTLIVFLLGLLLWNIKSLKEDIKCIKTSLSQKVDKADCKKEHDDTWTAIDKVRDRMAEAKI